MEKVGVLVVAYGAREAAIIDAFTRSDNYKVNVYVADKQQNPFNARIAFKHVVGSRTRYFGGTPKCGRSHDI